MAARLCCKRLHYARLNLAHRSGPLSVKARGLSTETAHGQSIESKPRLPQQTDLLDIYRGLVVAGKIKYDDDQVRVIMELRRLQKALVNYNPPAFASKYFSRHSPSSATLSVSSAGTEAPWYSTAARDHSPEDLKAIVRLRTHAEELAELQTPKGLLLTGSPGLGKSFLIDLWYASIPTPYKARKHYNQLVLEIFRAVWEETQRRSSRLHIPARDAEEVQWTRGVRARWRSLFNSGALPALWNPTVPAYASPAHEPPMAFAIAHRLVLRHWLLVFDEVQLLDVSSAGLLADVLSWFWRMGGVVVGTSNKVPDELYRHGVQRERLEPFVEALKARCPVLAMRGPRDWRRERGEDVTSRTWFTLGQESQFEEALRILSGSNGEPICRNLRVFGRDIHVPWSRGSACKFKFSELCDETLGPADYLTIASNYRTVAITDIPVLLLTAKDQGRRFISLVDALYESRCRIACLAQADPDHLFFPDALAADKGRLGTSAAQSNAELMMAEALSETQEVFRPNVSSYDSVPESRVPASPLSLDSLSVFSGEEEQFAYKRAVSRLIEMSSRVYAETEAWNPLAADLRQWETADGDAAAGLRQDTNAPWRRSGTSGDDDYASEAAYDSGVVPRSERRERPSAPRLSENHMWGVREDWGKRAGGWGKGAAVYDKPEGRGSHSE